MGIQPPEKTILDWRRAYVICHGEAAPRMDYARGWFRVSGRCGAREADVLGWTESLRREATQRSRDWSRVPTPLDRQREKFDMLVSGSAREVAEVLNSHPQYKWTRDFTENLRASRKGNTKEEG